MKRSFKLLLACVPVVWLCGCGGGDLCMNAIGPGFRLQAKTVHDRLERTRRVARSCECDAVVRQKYDQMLRGGVAS